MMACFLQKQQHNIQLKCYYNISNGTNLNYRKQPNTVRGESNRTPYSPLSEYQYNGDVLMLLCKTMDLPLPQVLSLAYNQNARETLKSIYEGMNGNEGKFDEFMQDLEKIYSIDNLIINGYGQQLQSETPVNITMQDRSTSFKGNLKIYKELMDKTERELVASFVENHDTEYIAQNYNEIMQYLTTPQLKQQFLSVVQELGKDVTHDNDQYIAQGNNTNEIVATGKEIQSEPEIDLPEGYRINEFGERIRPAIQQGENNISTNSSLSFKQRIAKLLQSNSLLKNVPFIEKFIDKQLNVLPPSTQERTATVNQSREDFLNLISNNGAYRNLPPIQRMSDPEKIAQMQRKMNQQQSNDDNERI